MTSNASTDVKEVIFVNQDAKAEYEALPDDVRETADARTTILQNGGRLPARQVRTLQGKLAGISEIRIRYDDDTYRVYFAAEFEKAIYVLDAGMKKSPNEDEIPRWQRDRLEYRMGQAKAHYGRCVNDINARFEERRKTREAIGAASNSPGTAWHRTRRG
jgi:phage-related protein